ncbi:MAG: NAD(P)H-dependent oxidoreductase [Rhizomicrobium sp.]
MVKRILVINGHPDIRPERFCAALSDAYAEAAAGAGHEIRRIAVGNLSFRWLSRFEDFRAQPDDAGIRDAQRQIAWAEHLVFVHPLWLGTMPAMLKGFLERVACGGFGFDSGTAGDPKRGLKGKSARLIVTMGMPALAFRLLFGGFGVRSFERGILRLAGVKPVRKTYIGGVELSERHRERSVSKVRRLAAAGL